MSNAIQLQAGRPYRGKFPVSLVQGEQVLFTAKINPHNQKEIDAFLKDVLKQFKGLKSQKKELRQTLLNLALPRPATKTNAADRERDREHPYGESPNGIFLIKPAMDTEVLVPLTNFTAKITSEVMRDDGAECQTLFELEACLHGRKATITVPAAKFGAMNWPTESLGAGAIVSAGQSVRDHTRAAIQFLSGSTISRRRVYAHTGWRKVETTNGETQWVFLHAAGAIGTGGAVENVEVDLPDALQSFRLPDPAGNTNPAELVQKHLKILTLATDDIVFPLVAVIWRAVLGAADFAVHFTGPTGSFKSELTALGQQHFGQELGSRKFPLSWSATENAIEGTLFSAKDAFCVIDDFAPAGGPLEVAKWHQKADRVFRSQGNLAARGRMRQDGSLRPSKPPRGLLVSTGEEVPRGQSIRARMLVVEVGSGEVHQDVLTSCQADANDGSYAMLMAHYLRFVAKHHDEICNDLRAQIESHRRADIKGVGHRRTTETVAHLTLGLKHFLRFAVDSNAMSRAEADDLLRRGSSALQRVADCQYGHQAANEPTQRFFELLMSAIASGRAHVAGSDGKEPPNPSAWGWRQIGVQVSVWTPSGDKVGWVDDDGVVWLDPEASHRVAQSMCSAGDGLSITAQTLRKRLDEKGLVVRPDNRGEILSRKRLEGRDRRVLGIKESSLLPKAANSSKAADTNSGAGDREAPTPPSGEMSLGGVGGFGGQHEEEILIPAVDNTKCFKH